MLVQKGSETQEKPFACDVKGCEMTFTNKDHLDWHHKKHEMMLNLGLVNKSTANEVADQTPTPTRFIRNCEEIGLFQDLQNVNPFDEIFKKAADLVKNGDTLEVHTNTNHSDDTLHTPHILPHNIENALKQSNSSSKNDRDCEVCVFPSSNQDDTDLNSSVIIIQNDEVNIKKKIKENIQNKLIKDKTSPVISVVKLQDLTYERNDETLVDSTYDKNNIKENNTQCQSNSKLEKIREMNRAAQNRCRKRKQQLWRDMEEQLAHLRQENKNLRQELEALKLLHGKCPPASNQGAMVTSIITATSQSATDKVTSPVPVPLLIQFLPCSQSSLASPDNSTRPVTNIATVKDNTTKKEKSRPLRKIVPNILKKKS